MGRPGCRRRGWGGSGRVGPAHPAAALGSPLVLVQPTPGAVLLGPGDRIGQALLADGARGTDGLGLSLADLALWLALAVRAEEENDILAAARGSILPAPVRPGRQCHLPTYLRHESISSTVLCVHNPASCRARGLAPCGFCPVFTSNALPGRRVPEWRPPLGYGLQRQ